MRHIPDGEIAFGLTFGRLDRSRSTFEPQLVVAAPPRVEHLPADPEIPARHRYVAGQFPGVPKNRQASAHRPVGQRITHPGLLAIKRPSVNDLRQF
jgi:hypothetical protein